MYNTLCTTAAENCELFQLCRHSSRALFTGLAFCCCCFCLSIEQTLGFKKGKHPKFSHSFTQPVDASRRVETPLWNMMSCLLYYSLYFFFVFLCIRVITPPVLIWFVYFVMYTSNVERRTVVQSMPESQLLLLCLRRLCPCLCVTSYVPSAPNMQDRTKLPPPLLERFVLPDATVFSKTLFFFLFCCCWFVCLFPPPPPLFLFSIIF